MANAGLKAAIDAVNYRNEHGMDSPEIRQAMNEILTTALMAGKCYAGFMYLRDYQVPPGAKPGIIFDSSPEQAHRYPDPTRVYFHYHRKLGGVCLAAKP